MYLLNRRRQILFVNRAWEALTGLSASQVKGLACRRRPRGVHAEKLELVLGSMAPPPEVLAGQACQTRRHLGVVGADPACWQIDFLPLASAVGTLAVLAKIMVLPRPSSSPGQPLSEKMLALWDRRRRHFQLDQVGGATPATERLLEQIRLAAQTALPVVIVGEDGAGKAWTARAIHEHGPQREQFFARLDCARLPAQAVADVLFPRDTRLSLPLATVYLSQPAHLPREIQDRLRHSLQDAEEPSSMPRIIAGICGDPLEQVKAGKLLGELYCRLSALVLSVPPLRERMAELPWWLERFLARAAAVTGGVVRTLSGEALELARAYAWPGNLAELYQVLLDACARATGQGIAAGHLPFRLRHAPLPPQKPLPLDAILEQVERRLIMQALKLADNNKSKAAQLLGIWRPRLLRRMENLDLGDGDA
jgi:DNA-binding NtrC family response regulator